MVLLRFANGTGCEDSVVVVAILVAVDLRRSSSRYRFRLRRLSLHRLQITSLQLLCVMRQSVFVSDNLTNIPVLQKADVMAILKIDKRENATKFAKSVVHEVLWS